MKLIASLAPALAEIEAGVVAKADQKDRNNKSYEHLPMWVVLDGANLQSYIILLEWRNFELLLLKLYLLKDILHQHYLHN